MRLALIGSGSFIAGHVRIAGEAAGMDVLSLSRDTDLDTALQNVDAVVNFALHPDFQKTDYAESHDLDLKAAKAALRNNSRVVTLSTRRVYPETVRWGAKEDGPAGGDETFYGRNKALSEAKIRELAGDRSTTLRLSNIIGFEYEPGGSRRTFMAQVLRRLRGEGQILFDMHPETERDFLPVELCAKAIIGALQRPGGVFNLGCGFPIACGDIADAVLKGFRAGTLVTTNYEKRDSFYLDMARWNANFDTLVTPAEVLSYCESLGWRLKNA